MTLDDSYLSMREAMRRAEDEDEARRYADYQEQKLLESIEAMESYWQGVMEQMPEHVRRTMYGSDVTS